LFLMSAYAGGNLTSAEQYELTRRRLLTGAQITSMKHGSAMPARPASARGGATGPGNGPSRSMAP
jgi:hypothetical protein